MHLRRSIIALIALILAGCGTPSAATTPPTGIPAAATSAPTAVALKDLDLEPLLIQPGDLPAGYTGAQVKDEAPPGMKDYPPAVKAIDQRFQQDGKVAGGVVVLLYEQQADLDKAKAVAAKTGQYSKSLSGVGEQAVVFEGSDLLPVRGVTFVRCHAIVDINMGEVETNEITAYAKRLDKRLQPLVCIK